MPRRENEQDHEPSKQFDGSFLFGKVFQMNEKRIVISYKSC